MEIARFDHAYLEVSRVWCDGRVRHPFPFFEPLDRSSKRFLKSFSFESDIRESKLANLISSYWRKDQGEAIVVRLPPQHAAYESDDHEVFIQSIGGKISIGRDEKNYPGTIYGYFGSDKEHRSTMRKCMKAIEAAVTERDE